MWCAIVWEKVGREGDPLLFGQKVDNKGERKCWKFQLFWSTSLFQNSPRALLRGPYDIISFLHKLHTLFILLFVFGTEYICISSPLTLLVSPTSTLLGHGAATSHVLAFLFACFTIHDYEPVGQGKNLHQLCTYSSFSISLFTYVSETCKFFSLKESGRAN